MVRCCLNRLRFEKSEAERRKLSYDTMAKETGLSANALHQLANDRVKRVEYNTIETLCRYFACGVGDLLEVVEGDGIPADEHTPDQASE